MNFAKSRAVCTKAMMLTTLYSRTCRPRCGNSESDDPAVREIFVGKSYRLIYRVESQMMRRVRLGRQDLRHNWANLWRCIQPLPRGPLSRIRPTLFRKPLRQPLLDFSMAHYPTSRYWRSRDKQAPAEESLQVLHQGFCQ
jgi:hypothetical protein